ncbi:hypothetical protein GOP47_0022471 [Adiantum capillus-veneris]|uniref:DUF8204 domain-containing protein n=1 Tax=Adiantum capillus-veneris TaxID=13818 RepID=A0A9D4U6I7_ADICA|nr:hypothetical protein GOP47_0022471 [Adiantum capillus-veneris]
MVKEATAEPSSGTAEGTCCSGLLYYSTGLAKKSKRPLCVGVTRPVNLAYRNPVERNNEAKNGQALRDFKFACMGQSMYRNNTRVVKQLPDGSIQGVDLPSCEGLAMIEVKGATKRQLDQSKQGSNEGGHAMPRPATQLRPPNPVKGVTPEDFGTKFVRSAGLVAAALKQNAHRVGNQIKTMVEDIFHPGGSGSK